MQCDLVSVSVVTNSCESSIQSPQRKLVFQPSRGHQSSLGKEPWITPEKKKHAKPWQRSAHITGAIVSLLVFACMSGGVCSPLLIGEGSSSRSENRKRRADQVWWKEGGHTRSDMHTDTQKETINLYLPHSSSNEPYRSVEEACASHSAYLDSSNTAQES